MQAFLLFFRMMDKMPIACTRPVKAFPLRRYSVSKSFYQQTKVLMLAGSTTAVWILRHHNVATTMAVLGGAKAEHDEVAAVIVETWHLGFRVQTLA